MKVISIILLVIYLIIGFPFWLLGFFLCIIKESIGSGIDGANSLIDYCVERLEI